MKIKNIKDVDGFFKVIDSCAGKVELITGSGVGAAVPMVRPR